MFCLLNARTARCKTHGSEDCFEGYSSFPAKMGTILSLRPLPHITRTMQTHFTSTEAIALPSYEFTEQNEIRLDSFDLIRCIGYGAYGQVWLCEKKDSNVLYAMKILCKSQLARQSTLNRTIRERELLEVGLEGVR